MSKKRKLTAKKVIRHLTEVQRTLLRKKDRPGFNEKDYDEIVKKRFISYSALGCKLVLTYESGAKASVCVVVERPKKRK